MISVVIPARNEQSNIERTVRRIQSNFDRHSLLYEILIIDDGSRDETKDIMRELSAKDHRVKVFVNDPPYGVGKAVQKGLDCYQGQVVIIAMADGSDDPNDMVQFVRRIEQGFDCCFGNRWVKGASLKNYPILKFILNRLANWAISILFALNYRDITNAFKAYSREIIEEVKPIESQHFNFTVELPLKAILKGCRFAVLPNHWYPREGGRSKFFFKEWGSGYFRIIWKLLKLRWSKKSKHRPVKPS